MDARMDPELEERLTDAVEEGNVRNVEELLQQTPMNLTSPDSRNNLLAKAKCIKILNVLLQNQWIRQSINDVAMVRKTALSEQILKSSNEADCLSRVELFIDAGACVRTMIFGHEYDALCKIISEGWYKLFNYIVGHIDDIKYFSIQGQNILHVILSDNRGYVVKDNILYFVKNVVERGLDIKSEDKRNRNSPLILSCEAGYCDVLKYLHRIGVDVNLVNKQGETPLQIACRKGHKEIVEYLIQHGGADVNQVDNDGFTALMWACDGGHKEIVECLIQPGVADVNSLNRLGRTALMMACRRGRKEIVEYLVEHSGADVNTVNNKRETALMLACDGGHENIVEYLIQHGGSDACVRTMIFGPGKNALCKVIRKRWVKLFNYIVDHMDDINSFSIEGKNILHVILSDIPEYDPKDNILYFVKNVVERGLDLRSVDKKNGNSPLILSCEAGYFDVVKYLHRRGVDVNLVNKQGQTSLQMACRKGHKEIVEYLIEHGGADVNQEDNNGLTALMMACRKGNKEIVKYLIQHGDADVNTADKYGQTALMLACDGGHKEIVEYLIQPGGVDVNKLNRHGRTALMEVCYRGHIDIVKYLIQHGRTDVNMINNDEVTALMWACIEGHKEITEYLIQHGGAHVNMVNNDGDTALMIACRKGHQKIVEYLIQHGGADVNMVNNKEETALECCRRNERHPNNFPIFKLLVESGANLTSNGVKLIQDILNKKLTKWFIYLIGVKPHIGGLTAEDENILHILARLNFNFTLDNFDWLLDYKVDINHKNSKTDSPLMIAAVLLNVKYLQVFTRHPAVDLNIQNNNGHTALHCLILGFAKFFQRIPPSQGDNYIQFLCQHLYPSYMECVDSLLGAGIDVNVQDNEGKTVLMMAARENDKQLIRKLLDAGAMVDEVDSSGRYALHYLDISDSVYDLTVFLLLFPSGRDSLIDVPCIHGNTFAQTVLQFPRLWNPCNVVSFVRWLIYRNCSLQHLRAEKGQSAYNDLSLDEFRPSERHELRRLLYLSGAPQEEIIATVNFQVEDKAEDKFHSRIKFKTLCFNLQSKCIRFLRELFGTGIREKLSELEISHLHNSPLLQDIIAVSTRIKEEQKRIPDELKRLLLLDDDASDNTVLGTRVNDKIVRLQLPENILLGEFNYVDDESEYCAYTVDKNRETEGRKYKYKVNMMLTS